MNQIELTKPPGHVRTIDDVLRWLRAGGRSTRLNLGYPFTWTSQDIQVLMASPYLPRLQALDLHVHGAIDVEGARALANCRRLDHLTHLVLGSSLDEEGVRVLATSPHLTRLVFLDLFNDSGHHIKGLEGAGALEALASSATLARLRVLILRDNRIGDQGAQALAGTSRLTSLAVLDLADCQLSAMGAQALACSPSLTGLSALDLSRNSLGDAGAQALARAPNLATLEQLSLRACRIGDAGAYALATSPYLGRVTALDLRDNRFGPEAKHALATSNTLMTEGLVLQ